MEGLGFVPVAGITVICYLAAEVAKHSPIKRRWLPSICGLTGLVLGVAAMYAMPGYPGTDIITSAAIGAVSGWAATGVNQMARQLKRGDDTK